MAKQTSPRTSSPTSPKKKRASEAPGPITAVIAKPSPQPSHDQIAERAFALYQERGQSGGDPLHDWLAAERELSA